MLLKGIFNHTKTDLYQNSLKAAAMRQRIRANNIANANTPGYQRLEVKFEEELRRSMKRKMFVPTETHEKHIPIGAQRISKIEPEVTVPNDPTDPSGMNNVDIEDEMVELAKNQLMYKAVSQWTARGFQKIKSAIKGRS